MKKLQNYIVSNKTNLVITLLLIFSIYSALIIGQAWDEGYHLKHGKVTFNYLLSFGLINEKLEMRDQYSSMYFTLKYFITSFFPYQFKTEVGHLINLSLSWGSLFGFSKIGKIIFNKEIGKICFLILFFYPIFFGHMAVNGSDSVLLFCNIWITYYVLKYLKNHHKTEKCKKYIILIGIICALGTGIQKVFLGSLLPLIILTIVDVFFAKVFLKNEIKFTKFIKDFILSFLVFYFILVLFWIDAHNDIFLFPIKSLLSTFSDNFWTGWAYNVLNGEYFFSNNAPKYYLIISLLLKSPEYFLFLFIFFIPLVFLKKNFFVEIFKNFNYKIFFVGGIIIFPHIILIFIPYPIYDGLRLFMWSIPYICFIPSLSIYYLINNIKFISSKIISSIVMVLFIIFICNFILITPYQYTYLNYLNGDLSKGYQKFENDYWGTSLKELVKKSSFNKSKELKFSICGFSEELVKKYLKNKYKNIKFVRLKDAEYIIMTNRTVYKEIDLKSNEFISNCFIENKGIDIYEVKRNNLTLSTIRELE